MEYIINDEKRKDVIYRAEEILRESIFKAENALKSIENNFIMIENVRKNWQ